MVRHRMRSRRGGTRGGSSHSQARHRSISDSPTSSTENPHYSNTRSSRGRAGLHYSGCDEAAARTTPFPLPLHQIPHTTQLRFCSSLNCPVIVATISISITEEAEQNIPMTIPMEETHRAGPSRNRGNDEEQGGNGGRNRRHGKAVASSSHEELGLQSDTPTVESRMEDTLGPQLEADNREGAQQLVGHAESDNPNDWACPIVEEPAMEEFVARVTSARWHFT